MRPRFLIFTILATLTLIASACAPAAMPAPQAPAAMPATQAPAAMPATQAPAAKSAPATSAPEATPSGPAMVNLGSGALGSHLVAGNGMTLYLFTKDTAGSGSSTCYDKCAGFWPALLTAGAPQAGTGVDSSKFGTITRTDGSTQVTYNGWPLYFYAKDTKAGDTTGEGVGGVWFCVSPTGDPVKQ